MVVIPQEQHHQVTYYEVCTEPFTSYLPHLHSFQISFKCSLRIYFSFQLYSLGEMVAVSCDGGSDIGYVSREIPFDEIQPLIDQGRAPSYRILSNINDTDDTISNMLKDKISIEEKYFVKCQGILRGHRSSSFLEIYATDCRFDKKELFVYLKRSEEYSYCRLVRRLFGSLKMKITVVECDLDVLLNCGEKYLSLSKFNLTHLDLYPGIINTPSSSLDTFDSSPVYRQPTPSTNNAPIFSLIGMSNPSSSQFYSTSTKEQTWRVQSISHSKMHEHEFFSLDGFYNPK